MSKLPKDEAIAQLQKSLDEISDLRLTVLGGETILSDVRLVAKFFGAGKNLIKWHRSTLIAISEIFEKNSEDYKNFSSIDFFPNAELSTKEKMELFVESFNQAEGILESMIEEIQDYWDENAEQSPIPRIGNKSQSKQIFIVHGRDQTALEKASSFLRELGLEPVILNEQPSNGATIIEKFERHSAVGFSLVLMTPDDIGSLSGENDSPRARQNVIFELGFFIGSLGRERVRVLKKGEIEIPSDYSGVVYIEFDDHEAWQRELARELQSAGFDIAEKESN